MGGAARLMTLLRVPFPPLRPSLFLLRRRLSVLSSSAVRVLTLSSLPKTKSHAPQSVNYFHSQPSNNAYLLHSSAVQNQQQHDHPWPEWRHFLQILSNGQGLHVPADNGILPEDAFVVYEELPDDFVRSAASCLAFARAGPNLLRLLSRRDIEAVVSNGTPFLFKSALETARRMRAFLETDGDTVSEFDKANTVDLMKYILSYASNPTVSSERNGLCSRELVNSSIRNLLHELGTVSCGAPTSYVLASDHELSGRQRITPRPLGRNIEMKRGDWICSKCNFMNFARNMKCLECEEPRPKKQLTGGEWECPQCNFVNYGRNSVCLRCDCRRPGAPLFNTMNSRSGLRNEEKAQHSFIRISLLNNVADTNNASAIEGFPEIMPQQRRDRTLEMDDGNKVQIGLHGTASSDVRNKNTTSSDSQSLGENFQFLRNSASQIDTQKKGREQAETPERWFKRMMELHDAKDLPTAISDKDFPQMMPMHKEENRFVVTKNEDHHSGTSPKYRRQAAMDQPTDTNFVPFVPFPPGYFARKGTDQPSGPEAPVTSSETTADTKRLNDATHRMSDASTIQTKSSEPMWSVSSKFSPETVADMNTGPSVVNQPTNSANSHFSGENITSSWTGNSLEGSAVKEPDPLDMSEEAKAERWFKRVAQIKDISELSQIPDEDFPSIMPMRKGVNRFVVSKRKTPLERRLTSQQHRRNLPIVSSVPLKKENDNS
ncbi:Zinc finger protein VAR3, chloroplastic [Sesamum alatum]|uniref:Zinc finger protein VAR3, chloroplastic n=1 Tax=Sesamum alatum TaxID=300844 RepID=A0AAE1XNV1_9LAMI|nr:Zinc finger protein VAR3, chloroplastic [Sesamum alatum]